MEVQELIARLHERGVKLSAKGGRLKYEPASRMPPELVEELRTHKHKIVAILQAATQVKLPCAHPVYVYGNTVSPEEFGNTVDAKLDSRQPAEAIETSWSSLPDEEVLPNWPAPPCPTCASLELWQDVTDQWRCMHCDPPEASRRLLTHARRLRRRYGLADS